jgi:hypothetical protein
MRRDCFAGSSNAAGLDGISVLATLPEEGVSVFDRPHSALTSTALAEYLQVYAFSENLPPAIPTGRIFVLGAIDVNLSEIVERLGYEIESIPPYAPNSAWILASDRSIATALSNLQDLMATTGLESVEPQMLRPSKSRS